MRVESRTLSHWRRRSLASARESLWHRLGYDLLFLKATFSWIYPRIADCKGFLKPFRKTGLKLFFSKASASSKALLGLMNGFCHFVRQDNTAKSISPKWFIMVNLCQEERVCHIFLFHAKILNISVLRNHREPDEGDAHRFILDLLPFLSLPLLTAPPRQSHLVVTRGWFLVYYEQTENQVSCIDLPIFWILRTKIVKKRVVVTLLLEKNKVFGNCVDGQDKCF